VIDIIRNEPKTIPVAMFGPQNMTTQSFSTQYIFKNTDSPDSVRIKYTDDTTWNDADVVCTLPGGTADNPADVELKGVTNRDQAWREGMSLAAKNRDQRRLINISTGREGFIPRYGDLCALSHDVPGWGYSGKVTSIEKSGTTATVHLSEPVEFTPSVTHFIAFRKRDGSVDGPYIAVESVNGFKNEIRISGTASAIAALYISSGIREDLTQYQFGPVERRALNAILTNAKPQKDGSCALTFVNYALSVHTAENGGAVPPPDSVSNLPQTPVVPIIDSIDVHQTAVVNEQIVICTPARGANYYEYQLSSDGIGWAAIGTGGPTLVIHLSPGEWWVRARGVGNLPGPWSTWNGTLEGTSLPLVELDSLTASTDQVFQIEVDFTIKANNGGIAGSVELKWGLTNDLGAAVGGVILPVPTMKYIVANLGAGQELWFWGRVIDTAGRVGPWYNAAAGVKGSATFDSDKIRTYISGQIEKSWLAQSLRDELDADGVSITTLESQTANMWMVKVQQTVGGRTALAGIGIGTQNNGGIVESQVLIMADRFAIIQPNNTGQTVSPFIVQGNDIYMASAFIQNASITNAKIADASITTAKIADANITAAKIANAQIINAHIVNAQVDRLKVAGNAVTTSAAFDFGYWTGQGWDQNWRDRGYGSITMPEQAHLMVVIQNSFDEGVQLTTSDLPEAQYNHWNFEMRLLINGGEWGRAEIPRTVAPTVVYYNISDIPEPFAAISGTRVSPSTAWSHNWMCFNISGALNITIQYRLRNEGEAVRSLNTSTRIFLLTAYR
jgi:hypothetical protein